MPDHLQDPCAGCEKCRGYVNSEPICDAEFQECLEWRVYDARRDLLERLQGEGERVPDVKLPTWRIATVHLRQRVHGPGWLVWIGEG